MAKKFFNDKVYNRKKNRMNLIIITVSIIGIFLCFIFVSIFYNSPKEVYSVTARDSVSIELYGDLPEKSVLFSELSGIKDSDIDVNFDNVDITKIGEYEVVATVFDKKHIIIIKVVDVTAPELELQNVNIDGSEGYSISDFVVKCTDNSQEECNISFYEGALNSDGSPIDYSIYSNSGTYEIQIVASDSTGNKTIKSSTLVINNGSDSVACEYGNLQYDEAFVLAIIVGVNGCAIDLNKYQNEDTLEGINAITETETNKLKKDIDVLPNLTGNIKINRSIDPILNNTGNGFVGYTLYVEAFEGDGTIITSYYLDINGNRVFVENPHNLK